MITCDMVRSYIDVCSGTFINVDIALKAAVSALLVLHISTQV